MIDLRLGDCLEILQTLKDNSVDSVVCDPPYHLTSTKGASKGFMGKEWDGGDIAFRTDVWKECLRVLKPGGYLLAFSSSRTYHRIAVAIEDAGFDIRDQIMWIYGQGFPKSHNIGKKVEGYEGWGTALKPAHEPIVMARKPLSEKSVAENVIKWGTGGINIDDSRIEYKDGIENEFSESYLRSGHSKSKGEDLIFNISGNKREGVYVNKEGRFPANIMFDEEAGKLLDEQSGITEYNKDRKPGNYKGGHRKEYVGTIDNDIEKKIEGQFFSDKGGASRFFYCPKASKKEKDLGLDSMELKTGRIGATYAGNQDTSKIGGNPDKPTLPRKNNHPTIKPLALMEYLIKMTTRPGGVVLDCFMGSGSTGVAAKRNGFSFIGVEKEEDYFNIAQQRIDYET
jgi:site-specific DNA-methyltransferase (adenine-specific)